MRTNLNSLFGCLVAVLLTTVTFGCKGKASSNVNTTDTVATAKPVGPRSMQTLPTLSQQRSVRLGHV